MRHLLRTAALGAVSVVVLASPAFADLTIVITVSGVTETFATLGDSLTLPTTIIADVTIAGEEASVTPGTPTSPTDILDDSVLSVINNGTTAEPIMITVSSTGLPGPVSGFALAGAGTWQDNVSTPPNTITMNWYANGTQLGPTFTNTNTTALQGFGTTDSGSYASGGPVTMEMAASYTLKPGGELLNRGFNEALTVVPEPSTWAMMVIGFMGLGYTAFRRSSKARAIAA